MRRVSARVFRKRRVWRGVRWALLVAFVVLVLPTLIGVIGVGFRCGVFAGAPVRPNDPTLDPPTTFRPIIASRPDSIRSEDLTYLTLPEWYIVYSADEYAAYVADNPPSGFPYFRAIGQFWGNYYDACAVTRERYSFNSGYNVVLIVIGASFTVENTVRGLYENTVGRVTEWVSGDRTTEDQYAQTVARDYGAFLHETPWYRFPFGEKLSGLWNSNPAWGPNIIRKWERRFALTTEYGVKALYAKAIGLGTATAYEADELRLVAWTEGDPATLADLNDVNVLAAASPDILLDLPRYESFTQLVPPLAARRIDFMQIAGNSTIMVTVLAPRTWQYEGENATTLWSRPILTRTDQQRVALDVDVSRLAELIRTLPDDVRFEHAYDY